MGQEKGGDYICLCFRKQVGGKRKGEWERQRQRKRGYWGKRECERALNLEEGDCKNKKTERNKVKVLELVALVARLSPSPSSSDQLQNQKDPLALPLIEVISRPPPSRLRWDITRLGLQVLIKNYHLRSVFSLSSMVSYQ